MKKILGSTLIVIIASSFASGSVIDDALKQVNEQLEQYKNVDDMTLIYTQVTERIPLEKEGAEYLARKQAEDSTRAALGMMDETKPFVVPSEHKDGYEMLFKDLSESFQQGRVSSYQCKVHLSQSQIGDSIVRSVQEVVSDMEGNPFYERIEDSDGLLKISKNFNAKDPESKPIVTTYKNEKSNKKIVIPLPIEWTKFFDHTPENNMEYKIESEDLIVLSYTSRKNGYDDVPISLHLSKQNGRFLPICYIVKYDHAIETMKFEDYKFKKGLLVPGFIELSYLIPEEQKNTPKWQPSIIHYLLK